VRAHPGPELLGRPPAPPPDTRFLPSEGRRINSALLWMMDQEFAPPERSEGDVIRGKPGSAGRARGVVRVVPNEAALETLRPGEVLVCPITTPAWSVVFGNAAALVTDRGGALSHPAIIAREHGIPAVLATGDGTRRLKDGDLVEVDGSAGSVTLVR
jgi:pyruvate,water dikinase